MAERKYVILADAETGKEHVVIFDRDLSHIAVAHGIMREMRGNEWGQKLWLEPVAAGFVDSSLTVLASGSESLKLGPRPGDQAIIRQVPPAPLVVSAADGPVVTKVELRKPDGRTPLQRAKGARAR